MAMAMASKRCKAAATNERAEKELAPETNNEMRERERERCVTKGWRTRVGRRNQCGKARGTNHHKGCGCYSCSPTSND